MENQIIGFHINGEYIESAMTDENGIVKLNYTFNKAGSYQVSIQFNESRTHYESNASNKIEIIKIKTITVGGDKITVTLTDNKCDLLKRKNTSSE